MDSIYEEVTIQESAGLFPSAYFEGQSFAVLDIETLGLSAERCPVILVGTVRPAGPAEGADAAVPDGGSKILMKQFFAEGIKGSDEEAAVLTAVEAELSDVDILVTFNGQSFDLPYLRKRCAILGLPLPRRHYSLDLYRVLRDCSDLGRFLPNLKQKTVESFAGLWEYRHDEISGGESISRYYDYVVDPVNNQGAKAEVLLHIRDDILQLYRLTGLLRKADMHDACYRFGFPFGAGVHKGIVKFLDLDSRRLLAEGVQTAAPFEYVRYGDEQPSYRWRDGKFSLEIPVLERHGLLLFDAAGTDPAPDLPGDMVQEGYVVLGQRDARDHTVRPDKRHCNFLVRALVSGLAGRMSGMTE